MKFTFLIPSTCVEQVIVEAESKEAAAQIIIDGGDYVTFIPESDFNINMSQESILDCIVGE